MKYNRILVTGGAGFIGSHLVDGLITNGYEVVVLDNFTTGRPENIRHHLEDGSVRLVRGDIRDFGVVRRALDGVDAIFHLAALTSVPQSVEDPIMTNEVNVVGTLNVLKAGLEVEVGRLVYSSSCAVYGENHHAPSSEDSPLRPISPYGVSKLSSEHYCRVFFETSGLETVCLRYFNVYGPRQVYSSYCSVIMSFLNRLLKGQPPVIYGRGDQFRDFVSVEDAVQANLLALNNRDAAGDVFNVGSGLPTTINRLAKMMINLLGKRHLNPLYADDRPGDIVRSCADISRARKVLGYVPKISLERGIAELLAFEEARLAEASL